MRRFILFLPILSTFLYLAFLEKRSPLPENYQENTAVKWVGLNKYLSYDTLEWLNLHPVKGIQFHFSHRPRISYFTYEAPPTQLLLALGTEPFNPKGILSDTLPRKIDKSILLSKLASISEDERQLPFWRALNQDVDIYECLKSPLKHTIVVAKYSNAIFHQVERVGLFSI